MGHFLVTPNRHKESLYIHKKDLPLRENDILRLLRKQNHLLKVTHITHANTYNLRHITGHIDDTGGFHAAITSINN